MAREEWYTVARIGSASSPERSYEVKTDGCGHYGCDCMAFRFQNKPIEQRACKHTRAVEAQQRRERIS